MFEIQNGLNLQIEPPNCLQYWDLCHNPYYYNGVLIYSLASNFKS